MNQISNAQRQVEAAKERANRIALRNAAKKAAAARMSQPTTPSTLSPEIPASGVAVNNAGVAGTASSAQPAAKMAKAATISSATTAKGAANTTAAAAPQTANAAIIASTITAPPGSPIVSSNTPIGIPGAADGANICKVGLLDLFNCGNYANSPLPEYTTTTDPTTGAITGYTITPGTGIRKFVNTLAGVGAGNKNELGNYIPIATPDTATYPNSDYYQIELKRYQQQLHADLPPTVLQGYHDASSNAADGSFHYLGPIIFAKRDRAVRIKFNNSLPASNAGGNLFLPVDLTMKGDDSSYSQNRALLHLHGGVTPWISDGTPHQWITPAGEPSAHKKGASQANVPDMPQPAADGSSGWDTWYYTNKQSGRMMWYHDHSYGLTRLNVYAGEVAPYILSDQVEDDLIDGTNNSGGNSGGVKVLPNQAGLDKSGQNAYRYGVPLVIQDKTFVPPTAAVTGQLPAPYTMDQLLAEDPTWFGYNPINPDGSLGLWTNVIDRSDPSFSQLGQYGQLWFPHIFTPNQNTNVSSGVNGYGRWDYGAWVWPPVSNLTHPAVQVPDPTNTANKLWIPAMPNPSAVQEAFMDTPVVNGTPYPTMNVGHGAYRFRVLNAANDRHWNLQLYYAVDAKGNPCNSAAATAAALDLNGSAKGVGACSEVKLVPAVPTSTFPPTWPTDGRTGGVPDPTLIGPSIIQIGTEGGLLANPTVIAPQPINYEYNRRVITALNVNYHSLLLGPAERADIVVDFSQVPDGAVLVMYNDAPAPDPGFDSRLDYFTNDPDQSASGGAPTTLPGYGPNTRTVMQFVVNSGADSTAAPFDLNAYQTALNNGAYTKAQDPVIVPAGVSAAIQDQIYDTSTNTFGNNVASPTASMINLQPKAIAEEFDTDWGRMTAQLGTELPFTNFLTQTTLQQWYIDPPTEIINNNQVQIWKITHNGVDTHSIHFHMVNVQVINRVAWDGTQYPPDPNEMGWKEVVRMNPLTDTIVAVKPVDVTTLALPFSLPDSYRLLDVTLGANLPSNAFTNTDPVTNNPITTTNKLTNFGWEYVWHCHLLGHEENDMMRPIIFQVPPEAPSNVAVAPVSNTSIKLSWQNNAASATGFQIQRAIVDSTGKQGPFTTLTDAVTKLGPSVTATSQGKYPVGSTVSFTDTGLKAGTTYVYQVASAKLFNNQVGSPGNSDVSNGPMYSALTPGPGVATAQGPVASISPATVAFTTAQPLNTPSAVQTVVVTNTGDAPLTVSSATSSVNDFTVANTCSTVGFTAPANTCNINITFAPTATGKRTGTLTVATNDPSHPTLTVALSGTGTALLFTPTPLGFGSQLVGSASAAQKATLQNVGTTTISGIAFSFTGDNPTDFSTGFTTSPTACTSLAAGKTCTLSIKFTPGAAGARDANLSVASNDPASPVSLLVNGIGIQPVLNVNPAALSFQSPVNVKTADQMISVANNGNAPLDITSIKLSGTNANLFRIDTTSPAPAGQTLCSTGASVLAINTSCVVNVNFTPTATTTTAQQTATLTVAVKTPATAQTVTLTGVVLEPLLTIAPTAINFGSTSAGVATPAQVVTLSNGAAASATATINSVGLGSTTAYPGTTPSAFKLVTTGLTGTVCPLSANNKIPLAAGASCVIGVQFQPTAAQAAATQPLSADLVVNVPAGTPAVTPVVLSGTATAPAAPAATATPSSLTFTRANASTAQTVTVNSTGTGPLTFASIAVSNTQFSIATSSTTCSVNTPLPAGSSCTVGVTYTPTSTGAKTAKLNIKVTSPATLSAISLSGN